MSTVGSASATGSVGGRTTTWASGSARGDEEDKMSMDTNYRDIDERDRYSTMELDDDADGMSDEGNASLVGFGEGAGSTVSGPTYTRSQRVPEASGAGVAERTARERFDQGEGKGAVMGTPEKEGLGKFYFEEKK
jgi:hypothetical protein